MSSVFLYGWIEICCLALLHQIIWVEPAPIFGNMDLFVIVYVVSFVVALVALGNAV